MRFQDKKQNAIHSGIGDRQDLFVKAPISEEASEDFQYATRLRGKKKHNAEIYPEVNFEYGVHYKGQTLETYNEKPYDLDVHVYPERCMEYDIEERRYLCYDRLWEVKAYFEAEVRRMTVEYAIEWEAKRKFSVQDTVDYNVCWKAAGSIEKNEEYKYAVNWRGIYDSSTIADAKELFTGGVGKFVGKQTGYWKLSSDKKYIYDYSNKGSVTGIVNKQFTDHEYYEAEISFSPWSSDDDEANDQHGFYRDGNTFKKRSGFDDDLIGIIFKAVETSDAGTAYDDFYAMMWESDDRCYFRQSNRMPNNFEGFDIFNDGGTELNQRVDRDETSSWNHHYPKGALSFNPVTTSTWTNATAATAYKKYEKDYGWGKQHRRIYRVKNGKMYRLDGDTSGRGPTNTSSLAAEGRAADCKDLGGGQGWVFKAKHWVKIVAQEKNVRIYIKMPGEDDYRKVYDFDCEWKSGTFGILNLSQAIRIHDIKVTLQKELSGRRPIDTSKWETHKGPEKDLGTAKSWLSTSVKHELTEKGLSTSTDVNLFGIKGSSSTPGDGKITVESSSDETKHILVESGTFDVDIGLTGCIPTTGWKSSNLPSKDLGNAKTYVRNDTNFKTLCTNKGLDPTEVEIKEIKGNVRDATKGSITVGTNIIVKASSHFEYETLKGRIPTNASKWFEFDGIGQFEHAPNALEYLKNNVDSPFPGFAWTDPSITLVMRGKVKPDPTVKVSPLHSPRPQNITGWMDDPITPLTKPIIVYSNNPPDAGEIYSIEHIKCGIANVCPNHLSKETGLVVIEDVRKLFQAEDDAFFNRPDYINKKREYTLLTPNPDLQKEDEPEVPETLGGCKLPEPEVPDEKVCRPDIDDFFWDGIRLIMWTCQPPVVFTTRSYEACVFAYQGEKLFNPLEQFEPPNPWTTYRLIPIEETIEKAYDYLKWVGTESLQWISPGTKIRAKTLRYFVARWEGPYKDMNKGLANSLELFTCEIPAAPEYYKDPETGEPMPHGYSNFHFFLESNTAFKADSDIVMWWKSKPAVHSKNVDKTDNNKNRITGTPLMKAIEMNDQIIIKCAEDPRLLEWTSGKYIGYGKVNGKEPLYTDGSGKADMINNSTRVVYFPDNLVMKTIEGPFIDVYIDKTIYGDDVKVTYKLNEDKTLVDFSSDCRDFHYWFTDWYTRWTMDPNNYTALKDETLVIDEPVISPPTAEDKYFPKDTFVESMEVTCSNPFVKAWADTLTAVQISQITGSIEDIDIMSIRESWVQWDESSDKGEWKFVTESEIDKITNTKNQNGRSGWFNNLHEKETDYEFGFTVQEKKSGDDDMYGAIFRFNPVDLSFYSFEMDAAVSRGSGGTGVNGMAVYRNHRQLNGSWSKTRLDHLKEGWTYGTSEINKVYIKLKGRNIKVFVNDVQKFDVTDTSNLWLPNGAWGPLTNSQPNTFFWNMRMVKPAPSPKVYGQVKQSRPMPWSPMIHNGYFYFQDKENILHAQSKVIVATPDANHEVIISPRPQQASAIIVQDNEGNNLRKVAFYDEKWNPTLENTESFNGNGYASYYLSYKGIDKATLKVKVNGEAAPYVFNDELSRVEFMYKVGMNDVIEVKYKLLYSYWIDMNHDVTNNKARIVLHNNYEARKMKDMKVIFEGAEDTPFYRAEEIKLNPLLNHNHTGFLYVAETGNQIVKSITMNITPKTLEALRDRKILITAKVVDELDNPIPNKKVTLFRNNVEYKDDSLNYMTNEAGEVYFYFSPIKQDSDTPVSKVDDYRVECDGQVDRSLLNYYVKDRATRKYVEMTKSKLVIVGGTNDKTTVSIIVRDQFFNKITSGAITIEITDTKGFRSTRTAFIPSSGISSFDVEGLKEKQGSIFVKVSYGMGFEDAMNYTYVKVIGG